MTTTSASSRARAAKVKRELRRAMLLDPGLARLVERLGYPEARARQPGFAALLRVIVSQQLSTGVAAAIWARFEKLCRKPITYRKVLNRDSEQLRQCGLSKQKGEYIHGLARMLADKTLDLEAVAQLDAEAAIAELIKVRGIGLWSAQIYAMFALGHGDIFPAGDLALQVAVQRYARLGERPDATQTAALARKWSPYRSSVALLMWKYYGATTLD